MIPVGVFSQDVSFSMFSLSSAGLSFAPPMSLRLNCQSKRLARACGARARQLGRPLRRLSWWSPECLPGAREATPAERGGAWLLVVSSSCKIKVCGEGDGQGEPADRGRSMHPVLRRLADWLSLDFGLMRSSCLEMGQSRSGDSWQDAVGQRPNGRVFGAIADYLASGECFRTCRLSVC